MANVFNQFDPTNPFGTNKSDNILEAEQPNIFNQFDMAPDEDLVKGTPYDTEHGFQATNYKDNVFDKFDKVAEVADTVSDPFFDFLKNTAANTGSTLLDVLHQIGRPQSAIMAGAKHAEAEKQRLIAAGEDPGVRVPILFGGLGVHSQTIDELLEGLKKGFSYEDETRAKDLMEPEFVKNHPVWASVLGFILDVGTDPLTFGAAKAVTVPVGLAGKGLAHLGGKSEKITSAVDRFSTSRIAEMFNVQTGDARKIKEVGDRLRDGLKGQHQKAEEFIKIRQLELRTIADDANVSIDDLRKAIIEDIERGALGTADSLTAKISPAAAKAAKEDEQVYKQLLKLEQESGVDIADVMARADDLGISGYVPHVVTALARRKFAKGATSFIKNRVRPIQSTHALGRKMEGTVDDINVQMLEKMKGGQFMHTDPALLRGIRTSRHGQEMAYINFNNAARDLVGRTADEFPEGAIPLNFKKVDGIKGKDGEDIYFPEEMAGVIKRQRDILKNKTMLDDQLKYFDTVQNAWKGWTLAIRPAYHMRNVAGNLWNAYTIAGVKNPKAFVEAMRMQSSALYRNNPEMAKQLGVGVGSKFNWSNVVNAKGGVNKTYQEIYDQAVERGVLGKGQYGAGGDIQRHMERELERSAGAAGLGVRDFITPSRDNIILQQGFKVGNLLEDNARLAVFLDVFKKTGSFDEAASMTKRALFDYSDLSQLERTVMKRALPFYTWTRKNIPAQLRALWNNPERARKLDIARMNIEYEEGRPDPQNMYDFYNRGVPIYLSKEDKGEVWKMYRTLNYLPVADLERLHDPYKMGEELISPILKAPFEAFNNYDTFRKDQIEEYQGETTDFLGVRMPVHLAHFAQLLVPIAEMNRANPFGMFGEATKDEDTGEWVRTNSWGMDQPLAEFKLPEFLPGVGGEYALGGTPRESTRDQTAGVRLLQYTLGLRPYFGSEGQGRQYNIKAFNRDKNSLKYYLNQAIKKGQKRRAEELKILLEQWEAAEKAAESAELRGEEGDYTFRGSRYYE